MGVAVGVVADSYYQLTISRWWWCQVFGRGLYYCYHFSLIKLSGGRVPFEAFRTQRNRLRLLIKRAYN